MIKKRSIKIAGHKTSVSLEEPFWDELKAIAGSRGMSLTALIESVDRVRTEDRQDANLSSALRLHVLEHLRARARP